MPLQAKPALVHQAILALEREEGLSVAKAYIDQAMEETATLTQADAWYYRGVIYEKLLRDQMDTEESSILFEETLTAYRQTLALTPVASQYHSFSQINLNRLWAYYLDRGRRYYKQEAFESAIQQFSYCKKVIPSDSYAYLYTALAMHQEGQYDLALHNYTHYLESGVVAPAVVYLGLAMLTADDTLRKPEKALQILEQALLQYPFDRDLIYAQIQCCMTLNQVEVKQKLVQQQAVATPDAAASHHQLGCWYARQGHWQQAIKHYQKAASLDPTQVEPVLQQGIVHYNQAAHITQEAAAMPEDAFQQVGEQQIKKIQECLRQSLLYFEKAHKIHPRDPLILDYLQIIYRYLGRSAQEQKVERRLAKYRR